MAALLWLLLLLITVMMMVVLYVIGITVYHFHVNVNNSCICHLVLLGYGKLKYANLVAIVCEITIRVIQKVKA